MSYASKIQELETFQFVELYEVGIGGSDSLQKEYYTDHVEKVTFDGNIYLPVAVERGAIKAENKINPIQLKISIAINDLFKKYIAEAPSVPITVKVTRVFLDDMDANIVIFNGELINITIENNVASIDCEANSELRTQIPVFVTQSQCNHSLFDNNCALDEEDFKTQTAVTVSGSTLISTAFDALADGYFNGGFVRKGTDIRPITNHVGNTITISVPFPASAVFNGAVVDVFPGCDKMAETCKTKFDNFDNFVGFPYIPSSNPAIFAFDK